MPFGLTKEILFLFAKEMKYIILSNKSQLNVTPALSLKFRYFFRVSVCGFHVLAVSLFPIYVLLINPTASALLLINGLSLNFTCRAALIISHQTFLNM